MHSEHYHPKGFHRYLIDLTKRSFHYPNRLQQFFLDRQHQSAGTPRKLPQPGIFECFLVPKSWRKWSVINSLDDNFHLISDIELPSDCFYLANGEKKEKSTLNTIFQIWEKRDEKRKKIEVKDHGLVKKVKHDKKIVEGADCEFILFGYSCGKVNRLDGPVKYKTTSTYFKAESKVIDALEEIDFSCFYENVAYVNALSMKEINYKFLYKL